MAPKADDSAPKDDEALEADVVVNTAVVLEDDVGMVDGCGSASFIRSGDEGKDIGQVVKDRQGNATVSWRHRRKRARTT